MLAATIRSLIAPVVRQCPAACGIVSITKVEVSTDFSYATVYVSALQEPKKALEFLEESQWGLQRAMSGLHRKRIPLLRFRLDTTGEEGRRIDALLGEASIRLPDDTSDDTQE
jgi:ribosome-binding factor A